MDARDVKKVTVPQMGKDGALPIMWDLQLRLLIEYQRIEGMPDWPLNLDVPANQEFMKDLIARVIEELAEAYEAFQYHGNMDNAREELADAWHFLVEALIFTVPYEELTPYFMVPKGGSTIKYFLTEQGNPSTVANWFWDVTYHLNIARNNLRNKKWKQTKVLAQKKEFLKNMTKGMFALIQGFPLWNMDEQDILEMYCKKNEINWFRIKSKY